MNQLLTYSYNPEDESISQMLAEKLLGLTQDQKAALGVAAFYEAFEPQGIDLDYEIEGKSTFIDCVGLMLQLSISGRLAISRVIAEELAVYQRLEEVKI